MNTLYSKLNIKHNKRVQRTGFTVKPRITLPVESSKSISLVSVEMHYCRRSVLMIASQFTAWEKFGIWEWDREMDSIWLHVRMMCGVRICETSNTAKWLRKYGIASNCIELHCRWILVRECHTTCMPIAVVDRYLCYAQFCRHYSWYNIKSQSNIHSFWQHIGVFLPFLLHLPLTFLFYF